MKNVLGLSFVYVGDVNRVVHSTLIFYRGDDNKGNRDRDQQRGWMKIYRGLHICVYKKKCILYWFYCIFMTHQGKSKYFLYLNYNGSSSWYRDWRVFFFYCKHRALYFMSKILVSCTQHKLMRIKSYEEEQGTVFLCFIFILLILEQKIGVLKDSSQNIIL